MVTSAPKVLGTPRITF